MKNGKRDHGRMTKRPKPKAQPIRPPLKLRPAAPPLFVGQWIRALGKTPREVAQGAPVNEGYLSEIINGRKKRPSIEVLNAIAVFLGIPRDKLHSPPPTKDVIEAARALGPSILDRLHDTTKH